MLPRFNIDWADPLKGFLLVSEVLSLNVETWAWAPLSVGLEGFRGFGVVGVWGFLEFWGLGVLGFRVLRF